VADRTAPPRRKRDSGGGRNNLLFPIIVLVSGALIVVWIYRPRTVALPTITCGDGQRRLIDARAFDTRYWVYSVRLEGTIGDGKTVGGSLDPQKLEQLSDALMEANEYRKWLVNSYNACAITQAQYSELGATFQQMDQVAGNIQSGLKAASSSPDERADVTALVDEYIRLSRQLGNTSSKEK
jgi:hypothetical protein